MVYIYIYYGYNYIIELVDSMSRDEPDAPLTQYITNAGISRARYTITYFKYGHRVLWLISNRMSVAITSLRIIIAQFYVRTARSKKKYRDLVFLFFLLLLFLLLNFFSSPKGRFTLVT